MKIEFKHSAKPLKAHELIKQDHPLFIGEFFGREARYERDEVDNRVRYIEKYLEPPLIPSNFQYTELPPALFFRGVRGGGAKGG